jgi:hypothetical protein
MMQAIRGREAHDTDAECDVYNAVFEELGLNWHWTRATLRSLAAIPVEFLAGAIAEAKARRVCRI